MRTIRCMVLEGWKVRRHDRKTEGHWATIAQQRTLNSWEQYQQEWNFIETDYGYEPSNNGLDLGNPSFAFDTKLAKFLVLKVVVLSEKEHTMSLESIQAKTVEQLKEVVPELIDRVASIMKERNLTKKADAVVSVMDKLNKDEAELRKLGPDQAFYDSEGKNIDETFSKKRIDERQKCQGRINKMKSVLNKALTTDLDQDWANVYNIAGGKNPPEGQDGDAGSSDQSGS